MADSKISNLTAKTTIASTDLIPIVDNSGTATTKKITGANLFTGKGPTLFVASSTASASEQLVADYICDSVADDVQIQAAIDSVATSGGKVLFSRGTFTLAAKLQITTSHMTLEGQGNSTLLTLANNVNDNVLNITGAGVIEYKVRMLRIDGNKANQTNCDGIYVSTSWGSGTNDTQGVFEDLQILNCKNNGFEVGASSDTRVLQFNRVRIRKCDGNGWYLPPPSCTDCTFYDCIAETIALNGFYIGCLNSHFTDCKTFYCGSDGGNNHGFYINGYNNYFTQCEAQDNYQSGFYGDGTSGDGTYHNRANTFINCVADSNNQNADASYGAGWQLVNCTDWQIIGGITMTRPYPSFTQRVGILLQGTTTRTNVIGTWFSGNSTAWSDTSSGTNYRSFCVGQSMETSLVPGDITLAAKKLNVGSGSAYFSGTGTRGLIDGGATTFQIQNFAEIFLSDATAAAATLQIDMFNTNDRTLQIANDSTGKANLAVDDDFQNSGSGTYGGSGKTMGFYGATRTLKQTVPTGSTTDTLITALQNLGLIGQTSTSTTTSSSTSTTSTSTSTSTTTTL